MKMTLIAIGVALALFCSIWAIAHEAQYLSLIDHSGTLMVVGLILAVIPSYYVFRALQFEYHLEEVMKYAGLSYVFFAIVVVAILLILNRATMTSCEETFGVLTRSEARYVSAYGVTKSQQIKANKWLIEGKLASGASFSYSLNEDPMISVDQPIGVELEFCTSWFGLTMFNKITPR